MTEKRVVGVSYDMGDDAPLVMLKASGSEADDVLRKARRQEATLIVRDPELVKQLYRVPIDQPIGRELFPVMAVLLAHVLGVDRTQEERQT